MEKSELNKWIEENRDRIIKFSDYVWELAETGLQEYRTYDYLTGIFETEGFDINHKVANLDTAFTAEYGNGDPVIGVLGEYDALPGLSQKPVAYREPVTEGANGQACNHNLLGVASLTACLALKEAIDTGEIEGTIRFYGCPAEETYNSKGWMVKHGAFDDIDIGITWHPLYFNSVWHFSTNAMNSVMFTFKGQASHASRDPHNGRSALDAVELMNVGVNYLREHMISDARIHYIITQGGNAPNIVPEIAESHYFIRAPKRHQVDELYERVKKIARGAAMMTETEVEIDFLSGTYNTNENPVIRNQLYENMQSIGPVDWTEDEIEFARRLRETLPEGAFEHLLHMTPPHEKQKVKEAIKRPLCDIIVDGYGNDQVFTSSTDVGDVSQYIPLAQFSTATQIMGSPGHSWQNVATAKMSIGHKGMLLAAKIIATTAFDFMSDADLIKSAKSTFEQNKIEYKPPFPKDHSPPYHRLREDILQVIE